MTGKNRLRDPLYLYFHYERITIGLVDDLAMSCEAEKMQQGTNELRIRVEECARCGGNHDEVTFRSLDRPAEGWTMYGACPANKQPIMLRVQGGHHADDRLTLIDRLNDRV